MNELPAASVWFVPSIIASYRPFGDVARPDMRMCMQRADDAPFSKVNLTSFRARCREDAASSARAEIGPRAVGGTAIEPGLSPGDLLLLAQKPDSDIAL
jgi:hypothetical protein